MLTWYTLIKGVKKKTYLTYDRTYYRHTSKMSRSATMNRVRTSDLCYGTFFSTCQIYAKHFCFLHVIFFHFTAKHTHTHTCARLHCLWCSTMWMNLIHWILSEKKVGARTKYIARKVIIIIIAGNSLAYSGQQFGLYKLEID